MHEYVVNLHVQTKYSHGIADHSDIVNSACKAGLDVVIITDSNVFIDGPSGYWRAPGESGDKSMLVIIGQEVYDQAQLPQKNHLLVLGLEREFSTIGDTAQKLIEKVDLAGGLTFLAHPFDKNAPAINQIDISWTEWDVAGFTGLEIWNGYSEYKSQINNRLQPFYYACNPKGIFWAPFPESLKKWDELLTTGKRVVAIGGSNAFPQKISFGPFEYTIFPYKYHFAAINTHIFTPEPLSGNAVNDQKLILTALRRGNVFVGNDLPASTRGFRFSAHGLDQVSLMGDEVLLGNGITLQIRLPEPAETHILKDGKIIKKIVNRKTYSFNITEPGVFRVEAFKRFQGRRRGWIYSNPIYVRNKI